MGFKDSRVVLGTVNHYRNAGFNYLRLCKGCQQQLVKTFIRQKTHYAILGIAPNATQPQIKDAFIKLSKTEHPDQNNSSKSSHEKYVKILEAYNVLSKEESRRQYDAEIREKRHYYNSAPSYTSSPGVKRPYQNQSNYEQHYYDSWQQHSYGPQSGSKYGSGRGGPYEYYESAFRDQGAGAGHHGFSGARRGSSSYYDGDAPFERMDPFSARKESRRSTTYGDEKYKYQPPQPVRPVTDIKQFNKNLAQALLLVFSLMFVIDIYAQFRNRKWSKAHLEFQEKQKSKGTTTSRIVEENSNTKPNQENSALKSSEDISSATRSRSSSSSKINNDSLTAKPSTDKSISKPSTDNSSIDRSPQKPSTELLQMQPSPEIFNVKGPGVSAGKSTSV